MRCALTITGKVQNAGYRGFIEDKARDRHLKGYVFNASDGSVKMICEGACDKIDEFVDVITLHEKDIFVENIIRDDISGFALPIPDTFGRVKTDTKEDTYRKLDKGIDAIKSVKKDTVLLKDIKEGQEKLIGGQDKLIGVQDKHTELLTDIKEILEKIAEK